MSCMSSPLFSFRHSKPGPFLPPGLPEPTRTFPWCENLCPVQSGNRNKCLVSCDHHIVFLLECYAKDMSKCCPVYMLSTLVDLASQSSGIFFFFWLCFEGSNGNFYPRGFQIMVTGLFSLWSGWILFEA